MNEQFIRNAWILGEEGTEKLHRASVLVAGLGGVGGYVCEVLARAGVGRLVIVDHDVVEPTNINRQIIAMHSTLGKKKTVAMKDRIQDIWPSAKVETLDCFLDQASIAALPQDIDYVVDAIDTVTAKAMLIAWCKDHNIPVISAMGAANKTDPTAFKAADISKTKVCPLAKAVRRQLRDRGITEGVKVIYSEEQPVKGAALGSLSYVPPVMGMLLAGEVIRDIAGFVPER